MTPSLTDQVQDYWQRETCGTGDEVTGGLERLSREWFERIEETRYRLEPFIHAVAQFTRHHGKTILEVGVGAGTDHLQWARAGCDCHGVDLTESAIETTRRHLAIHGFESNLRRLDAEALPFDDATFDLVYSWGVIHHSEDPEKIVGEIHRVLKPGGLFIGMMYNRHSIAVARLWVRHGLLGGRPWRTFRDIAWHHVESAGTKAYTRSELAALFKAFARCETWPLLTHSDTHRLPAWLTGIIPSRWGFFTAIHALKGPDTR